MNTMNSLRITCIGFTLILIISFCNAQQTNENIQQEAHFKKRVYYTSGTELLFQYVPTVSPTEEYVHGVKLNYFFNLVYNLHVDVTKSFGIIPGVSIRNVGIKTFDETVQLVQYDKIKRRSYLLGISGAVKIGNMPNYSFVYLGGAYEYSFHYKQKNFEDSKKTIRKEWVSAATEPYIPSVFIGYQFPKHINIQIRYYLDNFLNPLYSGKYGDFSKFPDTQILQFSISFQQNQSEQSKKLRERILPPSSVDI